MLRKYFFILTLFAGNCYSCFATMQEFEYLIVGKDTFLLEGEPLNLILAKRNITPENFWGEKYYVSTGCWRSYIGTWEIKNDSLFLNKVVPCDYYKYPKGKCPTVDLGKFFPDKFKNNQIFADWVTADLLSPRGKELFYAYCIQEVVYERTIYYSIENGLLKKTNIYDNSKSIKSEYFENQSLLKKFLYSNIRWENIKSEIESTPQQVVCKIISCDENAKIDSVSVLRDVPNKALVEEAFRVVKLIPNIILIYKKGQPYHWPDFITINFNMYNYEKYGHPSVNSKIEH